MGADGDAADRVREGDGEAVEGRGEQGGPFRGGKACVDEGVGDGGVVALDGGEGGPQDALAARHVGAVRVEEADGEGAAEAAEEAVDAHRDEKDEEDQEDHKKWK